MQGPVFVDTNAWVYARDPTDRGKHLTARRWLTDDLQDGMVISGLRVLNPFRAGVQEGLRVPRRRGRTSRMPAT